MKKLVSCVAAMALLTACGEDAPAEADIAATDVVAEVPADTMEDYLGAWDVTYPDGSTATTTNNADGSYSSVMADGTAISGLWTFGADESCWHNDGDEEATCYVVGAAGEDGTRVLTMADGTSITVTPAAADTSAESVSPEGAEAM